MSSSIVAITDPISDEAHKKSFHTRNDSGELDVFEAARYFSGYNEAANPTMTKENRPSWRGGGRISLDMPIRTVLDQNLLHHHHHDVDHKQATKEKIKYKQPSSPGGRLASFLNSLFNQSGSKKKKPKSSQSMKDEEESPGGTRRRRRSSISHFRSASSITTTTTNTNDAKSIYYSSSTPGFRTPPPYSAQISTAKLSHKDWRLSQSDHKSSHKNNQVAKAQVLDEKTWSSSNRVSLSEKHKSSVEQDHNKGVILKRLNGVVDDDGAESDSSSDLFELPNYDLGGYCSSGLPVFETTNYVASIKNIRGAPIANAS